MGVITMNQRMEASPEAVFDAATDVRNWAERISGIMSVEVLTDGPVGVGTRFRETRKMFGKEHTEEMEITGFDRPGGYRIECESCGCQHITDHEFIADGGGTLMTMTMRTKPLTLGAKIMAPLGFLFAGTMKKCIAQDLDDLRRNVEGDAEAAAAPA